MTALTLANQLLVLRVLTTLLIVVDRIGDCGPDGTESQRTEEEESSTGSFTRLIFVIITWAHPVQNLRDHPSCILLVG